MDYTQHGVVGALAGTRRWVRLLSVLGFVIAGFMILIGIGMAAGGTFLPSEIAEGGGGMMAVLGLVYACMGLLYLVPSLHLSRYGRHIQAYVRDPQPAELEAALEAQRKFWKFVGILALISILFVAAGMVMAIVMPVLMRGAGA